MTRCVNYRSGGRTHAAVLATRLVTCLRALPPCGLAAPHGRGHENGGLLLKVAHLRRGFQSGRGIRRRHIKRWRWFFVFCASGGRRRRRRRRCRGFVPHGRRDGLDRCCWCRTNRARRRRAGWHDNVVVRVVAPRRRVTRTLGRLGLTCGPWLLQILARMDRVRRAGCVSDRPRTAFAVRHAGRRGTVRIKDGVVVNAARHIRIGRDLNQ